MSETYAVAWQQSDQPIHVGRLEFSADGFRLLGDAAVDTAVVVSAAEITAVRVVHKASERLRDMKTLIVERRDAPPISLAAVDGLGTVIEIADVLTALHAQPRGPQSILVRIPIYNERLAEVHVLLRRGPPFQLDQIRGLRRHEVFVSDDEVIFLFQGHNVRHAVERLAREPAVWKAAIQWRSCAAGRPSIYESAFTWAADP